MEEREYNKYRRRLRAFLKKYGDAYPPEVVNFIKSCFKESLENIYDVDIMMQVKQAIGVKYDKPTYYEAHLQKIMENFDIGCRVVEIASGRFPALANLVATEQLKIGKGTITLYDPLLINMEPEYPNMTIKRKHFSHKTNIKDYDLLIATMPCRITDAILETAAENHKDFYVAICPCDHFRKPLGPEELGLYQQYEVDKAAYLTHKYNNGQIIVDQLPDEYEIYTPIVYNKR